MDDTLKRSGYEAIKLLGYEAIRLWAHMAANTGILNLVRNPFIAESFIPFRMISLIGQARRWLGSYALGLGDGYPGTLLISVNYSAN